MRKLTAFLTGVLLLLFYGGCHNANTGISETTETTGHSLSYEIKTVTDSTICGSNEITYPELISQTAHFDAVNLLIRQQLRERLEEHISEDFSNTTVNLHYSVTLSNENLLCLLYDGNFYTESAAHPSNIAFSICIDLKSEKAVLPTELFQLDTAFLQQFRTRLKTGAHPDRFTKEQWEDVVSYITAFTNDEIFETLQRNPQSTLAIYEDGVTVLFPVPRPIGDYIEIDVPNSISANIKTVEQGTYWRILQSENLYYYEITDASGTVAKAAGPSNRMPHFFLIEDRFVKCTTQAGTGISTQSGFYYDIENNVFSDIFPSIWNEQDRLVVYMKGRTVVIQDIFNKERYYKEIDSFEKPLSPAAEPTIKDVQFAENGSAIIVSYLTGENYEQVTETILLKEETPLPENEMEYLDSDLFPVLLEERKNYKVYTNQGHRGKGYYYEIYDNQGWQIETGYLPWRFNKLEYVGDSLLKLEIHSGGPMCEAKYYDVENRRVSMTYSTPVGNSQNLVADFTSDDNGIKLVVCDIFNPNVYTEFYDESFTIGVFTAQGIAEFSEDESSVTVSYFNNNNGELLTKTFSLIQDDWHNT